ncbi:hypothetical protein [Selenomonas sp. KH1T6]|uniref:hypothetical protein n=1 Tax=Selenomonas sp. KH1T6 TaxID=3158784 RepID=UPI0008A7F52C|nr:hypothetical protein SAMN05216583_103166 [Selenomonas ruminantium]
MEKYIKPSVTIDYSDSSGIFPLASISVSSAVTKAAMAGAAVGVASRDVFARNIKSLLVQKYSIV